MVVVGITGGIATGKSTVAAMFEECGAARIDADVLAREAVAPGEPAYKEVVAYFGPSVVCADGSINRRALGDLVFRDAEARRRLEQMIHPRVIAAIRRQLAAWREREPAPPVVVVEIPLLYEAGLEDLVDVVVVVSAEQRTQVERLKSRTGMTSEDAMLRLSAQMPLSEKEDRAAFVVRTEASLETVRETVRNIYHQLLSGTWPRPAGEEWVEAG